MYKQYQTALTKRLREELEVDAALMMVPNNIFYYTGFAANPHERFFALFMDVETGKTILFVPTLDERAAQSTAYVDEIVPVADTENAYQLFAEKIGTSMMKIAVEESYMTMTQTKKINEQLAPILFENMELFIAQERAQKRPEEIEHVKAAISLSEKALTNTWALIKTGMTELEIKAELDYQMTVLGADAIAFETIVLSGVRSALPHGSAANVKVEHGDLLLFDFGATKNGYHADLTRTCIIGAGTSEQEEIYDIVWHANKRAIAAVQPDAYLQQIDLAARNYIEEAGYGDYFTHRIGHGLGLDVHEYPSIHQGNRDKIEHGLLFTIEPGIYVPEVGGVRIEDDIYIQSDGKVNILSSFTKDLIYIES